MQLVARTSSLPYRPFLTGSVTPFKLRIIHFITPAQPACSPAECHSAIQPIANRRYAAAVARTGSPLFRRLATGSATPFQTPHHSLDCARFMAGLWSCPAERAG
ncbi:MAG: hypothetical protein QOF48_949 [Verrucomicrobiota bacterium]|jgi:hypothetical protein